MCGICGYLHFDRERPSEFGVIKKMADRLIHRGPDGEGFHLHRNLALGHRRLAIIDPALGHQPMYNDDKSIAIVFNGEIYNYLELRSELETLGHHFKTASDTEVIIRGYEQWGTGCLEKFNGAWAFTIWDNLQQRLFIARDRIGEKPLFYGEWDNTFIFGSEIKSILQYGIPVVPNTEMLKIYLSLGYIPAPHTYFNGIHKLMPGHFMLVTDRVSIHKYWDLPDIDEKDLITNKSDVYETFNALLNDSVKLRMRSDVPFGAMLSGGLDSSAIVSIMSALSPFPVETFTVGYKEKAYDERNLAAMVASAYHCNYNELLVSSKMIEEMYEKVLNHFD
jgi:asparagine synthase (glutamine-hydrolysing)